MNLLLCCILQVQCSVGPLSRLLAWLGPKLEAWSTISRNTWSTTTSSPAANLCPSPLSARLNQLGGSMTILFGQFKGLVQCMSYTRRYVVLMTMRQREIPGHTIDLIEIRAVHGHLLPLTFQDATITRDGGISMCD